MPKLVRIRLAQRFPSRKNGAEFLRTAHLTRIVEQAIEAALIEPAKATQNATNKSFCRKSFDERLDTYWLNHMMVKGHREKRYKN